MDYTEYNLLDIPNKFLLDIAKDKLVQKLDWTRTNDYDIKLNDINSSEVSVTFTLNGYIDLIDLDIYLNRADLDYKEVTENL